MSEESSSRRSGVQSIERAALILRSFTAESPHQGVSEIARRSGLTSSTAHRLLSSLLEQGLVMRSAGSNDYMLGPELLRLGAIAQETIHLRDVATPVMSKLRDAVDETVGLHVPGRNLTRQVLHQVESRQALRRIYTEIGQQLPMHQGAPGKVLMAGLTDGELEGLLSRPLTKATESTITDVEALRLEVEEVRRLGYAVSHEERVSGITSIAAPSRNHTGRVAAALSVSGPSSRMSDAKVRESVPVLKDATDELSRLLGAPPVS